MEGFVKGDIVVFSFPFSDYTSQKRRPALVVATPQGKKIIVCQITSKIQLDFYSIDLDENDFITGSLHINSFIRPNKLICVDKSIIFYKVGRIKSYKLNEVINSIIRIISE